MFHRQLFYTLLFALILFTENAAGCGLHQEMCQEPECIKTCSGKQLCFTGPHCVCMKGYALDEKTNECCHISNCPALHNKLPHMPKIPMPMMPHHGLMMIHPHLGTSRIRSLGHGISEKLLSCPLVPAKLVKSVTGMSYRIISFIPKRIVDLAEDGANSMLQAVDHVVDYIRYDVVLSGHTVGEIWSNLREKFNQICHENSELIDSAGRSVLHVQNQIHDRIYGIGRSILPSLKILPSYVRHCDYNRFLSKDAFIGSIMRIGHEGTVAREKAKQKIIHFTQLRKQQLAALREKINQQIEEHNVQLKEAGEKIQNIIKGNVHKLHDNVQNLQKKLKKVNEEEQKVKNNEDCDE